MGEGRRVGARGERTGRGVARLDKSDAMKLLFYFVPK